MCVVSMVYDEFNKRFPWVDPEPPVTFPGTITYTPRTAEPLDRETLRQMLDDFRKAVEAAKVVDALTGQKDCADPDKAKLEERVARLEKQLADMAPKMAPKKKRARRKPKKVARRTRAK
jgi:hypothetical protein